MTKKENLLKGIWKENPLLVSLLGMCPSLGITTKLENALGMGIAVLFVLVMSNLIISLIKKIVPNEIRIAVYIVVIATLVTIVDMVMGAFLPELHASLGLFIPLIVVNCIILGRAEAFASKNGPLDSVLDGIGMALGYTLALSIVSIAREFLGTGAITVWGFAGALGVGGGILAIRNNKRTAEKAEAMLCEIKPKIADLERKLQELRNLYTETEKLLPAIEINKVCKDFPKNYCDFTDDQKLKLGALINSTRAMGKLINRRIY